METTNKQEFYESHAKISFWIAAPFARASTPTSAALSTWEKDTLHIADTSLTLASQGQILQGPLLVPSTHQMSQAESPSITKEKRAMLQASHNLSNVAKNSTLLILLNPSWSKKLL